MGTPKLLLTHRGVPLLRRAVDAAIRGGCDDVVVVLGADRERYLPVLKGTPARPVHNPDFAQGMSRSEEHTSELQSLRHLICRLLLEKKKKKTNHTHRMTQTT